MPDFADFGPALTLRRTRWRGEAPPPDARDRLARRLEALVPTASGSLVLVRHWQARLPPQALVQAVERPHAAWREPVARLRQQMAQAPRPWLQDVGPGADCVAFSDVAEWLACAARDWHSGRWSACWWWQGLPPPADDAVARQWQAHPTQVPAALALLAGRGLALAACRAWPAAGARAVRQAVEAVHGLQHRTAADWLRSAVARAAVRGLQADARDPSATATPEADALVACALALAQAPAALRAEMRAHGAEPDPATESGARTAVAEPWTWAADKPSAAAAPASRGPVNPVVLPLLAQWSPAQPKAGAGHPARPAAAAPPAAEAAASAARAGGSPDAATTSPAAARPAPSPAAAATPARRIDIPRGPHRTPALTPALTPGPAPGEPLATAFGGLFHLLNVAVVLGLYGDFTQPRRPGLALHPWDFLALAGAQLLGRAWRADLLPAWLAQQAGRALGQAPGHDAPPPRPDWQLPAAWLAPWPPTRARWRGAASAGRVALWHPAGFCVFDGPGEPGRLGALLHDLAPAAPLVPGAPPQPLRDWDGWMQRLAPFLRARLARATGVSPRAAVALVLQRPARLWHSPGRLTVAQSLAALPLAVRLAGLDRDLGWLPAAGCALSYRFDEGDGA
jgi:hypothetical protein